MNKYIYTDHKTELVITILSDCILKADEEFFKLTKMNPKKHSYVGCEIKECK